MPKSNRNFMMLEDNSQDVKTALYHMIESEISDEDRVPFEANLSNSQKITDFFNYSLQKFGANLFYLAKPKKAHKICHKTIAKRKKKLTSFPKRSADNDHFGDHVQNFDYQLEML